MRFDRREQEATGSKSRLHSDFGVQIAQGRTFRR